MEARVIGRSLAAHYVRGLGIAALGVALIGGPALAQGQAPAGQPRQEPAYACSTTVPKGTPDAGVQRLAKITEAGARAAALAAVPGTVIKSTIENENGCAVYGVKIKTADGRVHEVNVDAGTGRILRQEVAAHNGSEKENPNAPEEGNDQDADD